MNNFWLFKTCYNNNNNVNHQLALATSYRWQQLDLWWNRNVSHNFNSAWNKKIQSILRSKVLLVVYGQHFLLNLWSIKKITRVLFDTLMQQHPSSIMLIITIIKVMKYFNVCKKLDWTKLRAWCIALSITSHSFLFTKCLSGDHSFDFMWRILM